MAYECLYFAALAVVGLGCLVLSLQRTSGLFVMVLGGGLFAGAWAAAGDFDELVWILMLPPVAVVVVVLAALLPTLLRYDWQASTICLALSAATGAGAGLAYAAAAPRLWPEGQGRYGIGEEHRSAEPIERPRILWASVHQMPGEAQIEVTLVNRSEETVAFDAPQDDFSPLLDPLVRIEAVDGSGDRLRYTYVAGCGQVYNYPRVSRVALAPGESVSFLLDLPEFYPSQGPLPEYSHMMLMNQAELREAGEPIPPPVRLFRLRVVFDNTRVRTATFPQHLRAEEATTADRVLAGSTSIIFVDPRTGLGAAKLNDQLLAYPPNTLF